MSERVFPRSPREMMAGWIYLPRLIDKIRLHLAGQLHSDYQENFLRKGFDARWFTAAGIAPETLVEVVRKSPTDGQVCDWIRIHINSTRSAERAALNLAMPLSGRDPDPAVQERLRFRKEQLGMLQRDDIQTFFDCIDADEAGFKRGTSECVAGHRIRACLPVSIGGLPFRQPLLRIQGLQ